jgi:hypothetical protein
MWECNKMYHKGILFAEHNFGPFQGILFESQSKTGISKYLNFMREVRPEIHFRSAKTLHCLNPNARKTSENDSKGQITPAVWFAHASGYRCSLLANFSVWWARASKNPIFWKIQNKYISTGRIQTKFSTRKRLNTRNISLRLTCGEFRGVQEIFKIFWIRNTEYLAKRWVKYTIVLVCVML